MSVDVFLLRPIARAVLPALALCATLAVACARSSGSGGPPGAGGALVSAAPTDRLMIPYDEVVKLTAPPADLREAYGPDPLQVGELRLPPAVSGKRPVVVLVHGGCWQSEYDMAHIAPAAAALAREGYVVWVPEYRRVGNPGGGYPGTFDDIALAIAHLRTLAQRVPAVDTSRVVLAGHSAGGQLVLWAGRSAPPAPGTPGSTSPPLRVAGVVSLAGITDLATYGAGTGSCNSAVTPLMGGTAAQAPDRYRAVSPVERLPLGVPAHLVHGAADPIVPVSLSETYAERARAAGDQVVVTPIPGAGHFDVIAPQSGAWRSVVAAIRALAAPESR
jgi:acetyl esterase/lipase